MMVSLLLKCSRCGNEFNLADGCVDVFIHHKTDRSIGFEFEVKEHDPNASPTSTLDLECLADWFMDCGMEKSKAKELAERYRPKKINVNHVV